MVVHVAEPTAARESRQHVGVSSTVIRTEVLHRSMEATARNLEQWNPSPEIDSHLERALRDLLTGKPRVAVAAHILAAVHSNHLEGEQNLQINGTADRLVEDLERIVIGQRLGIKALCRKLRPILRGFDAGSPAEAADALGHWRDLRRSVPTAELTRPGVRRELGVKLSRVMDRLLGEVDR